MNTVAWLMIAACIVTETVEQSLYRKGSTSPPGRRARFIVLAVILNNVALAMWLVLIKRVPLGIALPLMGAVPAMVRVRSRPDRGRSIDVVAGVLMLALLAANVAVFLL